MIGRLQFYCGAFMLLGMSVTHASESGRVTVKLRGSDSANAAIVEEVELYGRSHALIIGIDEYTHGWPRLSMGVADAKAIAAALTQKGFSVDLKLNLNSRQLRDALEEFYLVKGEDPEARLFVWFAGHGHSQNGEGFLIPTDAPKPSAGGKFYRKALPLRRIGEYVRLAEAKHAFAVFDSCFSGTVFESARALPPSAVTRATTFPVRQFLTSGDAGQTVSDNGSFRELFIRALQGNEKADANQDGYVTASEMGLFMSDRVTNLTQSKQTPRYGKLRDKDWDRGDFVFTLPVQQKVKVATRAESPAPATNGSAEAARIQQESLFWKSIQNSGNAASYQAYLSTYPNGAFSSLARAKLASIQSAASQQTRSAKRREERNKADAQALLERQKLDAQMEAQRRRLAAEQERLAADAARLRAQAEEEQRQRRQFLAEQKKFAAEAERLRAQAQLERKRLAQLRTQEARLAPPARIPGTDGNYDGRWTGRMICDKGTSDERTENVRVDIENNQFNNAPGISQSIGDIHGTITAAGKIEVTGSVDIEMHPGLMAPADLTFTGRFAEGEFRFGGDHGSRTCEVTLRSE